MKYAYPYLKKFYKSNMIIVWFFYKFKYFANKNRQIVQTMYILKA